MSYADALDAMNDAGVEIFGEEVIAVAGAGQETTFKGVFDFPELVEPSDKFVTFWFKTAGAAVAKGNHIVRGAATYLVIDARPDEGGGTLLHLQLEPKTNG